MRLASVIPACLALAFCLSAQDSPNSPYEFAGKSLRPPNNGPQVSPMPFWPEQTPLHRLRFAVVNTGGRPVLALGLRVTSSFAAGPPVTTSVVVDLLSDPGALQSGGQIDQPFIPPRQGKETPAKVDALPEFVIYADSSVGGDQSKAATVFSSWKVMHDQYQAYSRMVEKLRGSSDLRTDLRKLEGLLKHSVQPLYPKLLRELKQVSRCVSRAANDSRQMCVESHIISIQSSHKKYAAAIGL